MNCEIILSYYWKELRNLFGYTIVISYCLKNSLLLFLEMSRRISTPTTITFTSILTSIVVGIAQIAMPMIANPMAAVTKHDVGILDLMILCGQCAYTGVIDTWPAPGLHSFFRRSRSFKGSYKILAIKHHNPPHDFHLSKE